MEMDQDSPRLSGRGVTLNDLRSQQHSLNMQLLLAMRVHDGEAQKRLEGQLAEIQQRIDQFLLPNFRRRHIEME